MSTKTIVRYRRWRPKTRRRSHGLTIPAAVVAGFTPTAVYAYLDYKQGGFKLMGEGLLARLTSINLNGKMFGDGAVWQGLVPIVAGLMVHKYVGGKLGVNKALAQAGVPFIRI